MASEAEKTASAIQPVLCKICNVMVNVGCDGTHKAGRRHLFLEKVRMSHVTRSTRWLCVSELPHGMGQYELTEYFRNFGMVTCTYFPRNKPYCFVEFSHPVSKTQVLKQEHWFGDKQCFVSKIPTSVAKDHSGYDVYHGRNVLENINYKSTIENQIKTFLEKATLSDEELMVRERFVALLSSTLQDLFPGSRVDMFGSVTNGMAFSGCELDLSLFLLFERAENEVVHLDEANIPGAQDIILGKFPKENLAYLSKESLLLFISKFLVYVPGFKSCNLSNYNEFPCVKFMHGPSNVRVNLSIGKSLCLANSQLLHLYGQLDFYIYALLMVLRFWGKRENFAGVVKKMSTYAFSWLIIFYLENKNFVPTVEKLASLSDLSVEAESWDCSFTEDIDLLPVGTKDKSFGELIMGFFEFYAEFDFMSYVICPRDGSTVLKSELTSEAGDRLDFQITLMSVQDVFDLTSNITSSVNKVVIDDFQSKCKEQLIIWKDMIKNRNVCLKFLFDNKLAKEQMSNFKTSMSHTILLSSHELGLAQYDIGEVCNFVLEVFKRVFLLRCTVTKTSPEFRVEAEECCLTRVGENASKRQKIDGSSAKFIAVVTCQVFQRTWVGRKNFQVDSTPPAGIQRLDYEESISQVLVVQEAADTEPKHTFKVTFSHCEESDKMILTFEPVTTKNELTYTVIPFVKKYVGMLADVSLKAYLTSK